MVAMRRSADQKRETHEKIVATAARAIRRDGFEGTSVADLMAEAGLTHGGFYAHFDSREAMLAEAFDAAAADSLARLTRATSGAADPLAALVDVYLSDRHVEHPEAGCALAALGSEARRMPDAVRAVATRRIKELVDLVGRQQPDWGQPGAHERALATVSALVGSLIIARIADDPALADGVRAATRAQVRPPARKR